MRRNQWSRAVPTITSIVLCGLFYVGGSITAQAEGVRTDAGLSKSDAELKNTRYGMFKSWHLVTTNASENVLTGNAISPVISVLTFSVVAENDSDASPTFLPAEDSMC